MGGDTLSSVPGSSASVEGQGAISSQPFRHRRQRSFSPPRTTPVIVAGDLDSASEEDLPSLQWHELRDHKLIGLTSLHINGYTYGPDQVELDLVSVSPLFRFRTNPDSEPVVFRPGKIFDVILSPKETFSGVASFVLSQHNRAIQTKDSFASLNRGILVPSEGFSFLSGLSKAFRDAMPEWLDRGKVKWDEANTPSFQLVLKDDGSRRFSPRATGCS